MLVKLSRARREIVRLFFVRLEVTTGPNISIKNQAFCTKMLDFCGRFLVSHFSSYVLADKIMQNQVTSLRTYTIQKFIEFFTTVN